MEGRTGTDGNGLSESSRGTDGSSLKEGALEQGSEECVGVLRMGGRRQNAEVGGRHLYLFIQQLPVLSGLTLKPPEFLDLLGWAGAPEPSLLLLASSVCI